MRAEGSDKTENKTKTWATPFCGEKAYARQSEQAGGLWEPNCSLLLWVPPRIALLAWIGKGEGKRSTPIKEVVKKGKESEIKLQISNRDEKEILEQILNEVITLFIKSLLFML